MNSYNFSDVCSVVFVLCLPPTYTNSCLHTHKHHHTTTPPHITSHHHSYRVLLLTLAPLTILSGCYVLERVSRWQIPYLQHVFPVGTPKVYVLPLTWIVRNPLWMLLSSGKLLLSLLLTQRWAIYAVMTCKQVSIRGIYLDLEEPVFL